VDVSIFKINEKFFIEFFDNQYCILVIDNEGSIIYINKKFINILNITDYQSVINKNIENIFSENYVRELKNDFKLLLNEKGNFLEKEEKIEINNKIFLKTSRFLLYSEKLNKNLLISVSADITYLKNLEFEIENLQKENNKLKELYENEKMFFDALMENMPDVIYFKDRESRMVRTSKSHAKLFKLNSPEEMIGKTDFDYFTYEHASEAFNDEQNIIKTGKPIINKIEKETHPDGSITWVITNKLPLYDKKGNIIGTFGISKDITERYNMEQEIKRKNELLKIQEEELRAQKEELEKIVDELNKVNVSLEEKNEEIRKQAIMLEQQKEELLKLNNDLSYTNVLLEERQQQIEEQTEKLKKQAEELNIQRQELLEVNRELRKLNATKDKFFSIIAHDIKNPFNTILGFSELLFLRYDNLTEEKRKKYIETIYQASSQLYKLLENLLQWSRSQLGFIEVHKEPISLKELVDNIVIIFKDQYEKKNNKIVIEIPSDLYVYADINLLNTVLRNLISNAIKFTENGKIEIRANISDDKKVMISIKDSGIGIPNEKLKNLFDLASVKSIPGTRGEIGTGLGLILCKEFIEKMNGSIEVYSEEGKGTNFIVILPSIQ